MMIELGEFVVMGFVTVRNKVGLGVGRSPMVEEESDEGGVVELART